jgi:hypothetical protein
MTQDSAYGIEINKRQRRLIVLETEIGFMRLQQLKLCQMLLLM